MRRFKSVWKEAAERYARALWHAPEKKLSEPVELVNNAIVPFQWATPKWGRAEFQFCVKWKRGKCVEVFIQRVQQETNELFVIRYPYADGFQVSSWTHRGVGRPDTWRHMYCRWHKCPAFSVYVPDDTHYLRVLTGSTLNVVFERKEGAK